MGDGRNRSSETRLVGIIDRDLRRRILRNERQIIPESLRFEQPQRAPLRRTSHALGGAQASWRSASPNFEDYDSKSYAAAKLGSFGNACRVLQDPTGSSLSLPTGHAGAAFLSDSWSIPEFTHTAHPIAVDTLQGALISMEQATSRNGCMSTVYPSLKRKYGILEDCQESCQPSEISATSFKKPCFEAHTDSDSQTSLHKSAEFPRHRTWGIAESYVAGCEASSLWPQHNSVE